MSNKAVIASCNPNTVYVPCVEATLTEIFEAARDLASKLKHPVFLAPSDIIVQVSEGMTYEEFVSTEANNRSKLSTAKAAFQKNSMSRANYSAYMKAKTMFEAPRRQR